MGFSALANFLDHFWSYFHTMLDCFFNNSPESSSLLDFFSIWHIASKELKKNTILFLSFCPWEKRVKTIEVKIGIKFIFQTEKKNITNCTTVHSAPFLRQITLRWRSHRNHVEFRTSKVTMTLWITCIYKTIINVCFRVRNSIRFSKYFQHCVI